MGDSNADDLAHVTHADLLSGFGCLRLDSVLRYGTTTPASKNWEVLYIDDFI